MIEPTVDDAYVKNFYTDSDSDEDRDIKP